MSSPTDFTRLRKTITIHRIIQVLFLALLAFTALKFQSKIEPSQFLRVIFLTIAIQLVIFYPMLKLAGKEAAREVTSLNPNLGSKELQDLRRMRIFTDILKGAFFIFFVTFAGLAPAKASAQALILFSFIFTTISYLQYFNAAARKLMRNDG